MSETIFEDILFPELVFGICGAIGVDIAQITSALQHELQDVGYNSISIKLTDELYAAAGDDAPKDGENDYFSIIRKKIAFANSARKTHGDAAYLGLVGIQAIRRERKFLTGGDDVIPEKTAYIIHQLKRPEEVELLRRVYGKKFILISAYGSEVDRKALIVKKIKKTAHTHVKSTVAKDWAEQLVEQDADEGEAYGQRLRDTFHLADVFVEGVQKNLTEKGMERFIQAFFGRTDLAPSKDEYGMYAAKSASLRSADLSRQVGAAIFTDDGELITQGCNEVPKAFGGTYWDTEEPDFRDVKIGFDPNEVLRKEILKDLFDKLMNSGYLSDEALKNGSALEIAEVATAKARVVDGKEVQSGPLADALIMDLTEYGRIVHAEMCALCDAARTGKSVKGATLFCTTFPCHNCTKHLLACGIKRVVYMEPYPKSKAKELHENEIDIESTSPKRVSFVPFLGISPLRYRDIFQKGKRKNSDGTAKRWHRGGPRPTIDMVAALYPDIEAMALVSLIGTIESDGDKQATPSEVGDGAA